MSSGAGMAQTPILGSFLVVVGAGILATVGRSAERLERNSAFRHMPDCVIHESNQ